MPYFEILVTFAAVHLAAAATPGPNLIYVTRHASSGSRRNGFLAVLGILLGVITWSSATALGLGAVLAKYPPLYTALRYAGAIYLLWLGARMIISAIKGGYRESEIKNPSERPALSILLGAYFVNMSNPKTIAYYTSLFSVLIPANSPSWLFLASAGVALGVSAIWWCFVALLFSRNKMRRLFTKARKYLDMVMGSGMMLLGARIAAGR